MATNPYLEQRDFLRYLAKFIDNIPKQGMHQDQLILSAMQTFAISEKMLMINLNRYVNIGMIKIEDELIIPLNKK